MDNLKWGCDFKTADNICCFNRHYAEHSGYFESKTSFLSEVDRNEETTYYDSVTGKPLFIAPRGRNFDQFLQVVLHDASHIFIIVACIGITGSRVAKFSG